MAQIVATEINGRPALVAADLVARQRSDGFWSVRLADGSGTLTGFATEAQARQILSEV